MSLKRDDLLLYSGPGRHCLILSTLKANIGNCVNSAPEAQLVMVTPSLRGWCASGSSLDLFIFPEVRWYWTLMLPAGADVASSMSRLSARRTVALIRCARGADTGAEQRSAVESWMPCTSLSCLKPDSAVRKSSQSGFFFFLQNKITCPQNED